MTGEDDRYCLNCGRPLTEGAVRPAKPSAPAAAVPPPEDVLADEDADEGELSVCPGCGASNAARRRRCGRCGRDLSPTTASPPVVRQLPERPALHEDRTPDDLGEPPAVAPSPATARRRRGVAIAVVGLGAILGTGLGVAAATGMGPFATVAPVTFDAAAYPAAPRHVSPVTAASSSTAPGDGSREFGPDLTRDDDLTTAWAPEGEAEGALLRHAFVAPVWVTRLEVATGDQHDAATFAASGKVTRVMVDLGSRRVDATIAPTDGVQVIRLPEPVLTDEVTWEITGTSGDGAAISEVRYVGWPADEEDRAASRRRP